MSLATVHAPVQLGSMTWTDLFADRCRFEQAVAENVAYSWNDCSPEVGTLYTPELEKLLGPAPKKSEPLENEPVVCRPEEALDCFLRTRMDVLVLGEYFIERRQAQSPSASRDVTGNSLSRANHQQP